MDDTELYVRHITDMVRRVDQHHFVCYSEFLLPQEYQELIKRRLFSHVYISFWGGYSEFERGMLCISPTPIESQEDFPIVCLHAYQTDKRFGEALTHRDFLGSLMNLGIARHVFGDLLANEHDAYLFCSEKMAPFLLEEWRKVKHSAIACERIDEWNSDFVEQRMIDKKGTVSSIRLDSIIAFGFSFSRTKVKQLIAKGDVCVNHIVIERADYQIKEQDLISVRGFGRLFMDKIGDFTRKERIWVTVKQYR